MPVKNDRRGEDLMRGHRVARMRAEMGLSLRGLAELLDVSPSSVRRWEIGGCSVVVERAVRSVWLEPTMTPSEVA